MKKAQTLKALYTLALRLLARREHSTAELTKKLQAKTDHPEYIPEIITVLTQKNLLSDARFTESYTRMRAARGYGKLRIEAELKARGISPDIPLGSIKTDIRKIRAKKFGEMFPNTLKEKAKQARYLQYKGFALDEIRKVLHNGNDDE